MRRVPAPHRVVDDEYIVARPGDGAVLVLTPLVGWVWANLDVADESRIAKLATEQYPEVPADERTAMLNAIMELLETEGLVE